MKNLSIISLLLLVYTNLQFTIAQWKTTPYEDNIICGANAIQQNSRNCSDGNDGSFVVWEDYRNQLTTGCDIYLQRINKDGYTLFTENGIPICTADSDQNFPQVIESNNGSAIIFWLDSRTNFTNSTDLYAQKVDAQGNILWTLDGIPVSDYTSANPGPVYNFNLVSDGEGGVFITWQLGFAGYNMIRAQRINSDGNTIWNPAGLFVTNGARDDRFPQIIRDNYKGGIVIVFRGTVGYAITAQRVSPEGNLLWSPQGITVFSPGPQTACSIAPGDIYSNGGLVAITYAFGGPVYAQLLDTLGNKLWGTNGITVNNTSGQHFFAKIENDIDESKISPNIPGIPDNSFGEYGIVRYYGGYSISSGNDVAIQSDGKIVTGGYRYVYENPGYSYYYLLVRFKADGTPDSTFGLNGAVTNSIREDEVINSIAIQDDGKIVGAGASSDNGYEKDAFLVRYNSDGSIDN